MLSPLRVDTTILQEACHSFHHRFGEKIYKVKNDKVVTRIVTRMAYNFYRARENLLLS